MPDSMTVDLSDFDDLVATFEDAPDKVTRETVAAIHTASRVGIRVAKAYAPVGPTGDLRDSIEELPIWGVTGKAGVSGGFRATIFYAWFLEAGTARIAPRAFMQHGLNAAESVFLSGVHGAVDKALA